MSKIHKKAHLQTSNQAFTRLKWRYMAIYKTTKIE